MPILLVESDYERETHRDVMNALKSPSIYQRLAIVKSNAQDSSASVTRACDERGFRKSRFRLVGAYSRVSATANGLSELVSCTIEVVCRAFGSARGPLVLDLAKKLAFASSADKTVFLFVLGLAY